MNRLCASLSLGLALMATSAMGANFRTVTQSGVTLGGPTLINQQGTDLPMPAPLSPTPEVQYSGPVGELPVITTADPGLFPCVKYRDQRNIAPCAVPMIVQVPDPCACRDRCNPCAPRPCVNVQICVPQTGCPTVCVTRHGNKTRFDYGKYAIDVVSINGRIVVDYDD